MLSLKTANSPTATKIEGIKYKPDNLSPLLISKKIIDKPKIIVKIPTTFESIFHLNSSFFEIKGPLSSVSCQLMLAIVLFCSKMS